jgi:hypothetical protein
MVPILNRWYPANTLDNFQIENNTHLDLMFPVCNSTIHWSEHSHEFLQGLLIWRVLSFPKVKVKKEVKGYVNFKDGIYYSFHAANITIPPLQRKGWENHPATIIYEVEE